MSSIGAWSFSKRTHFPRRSPVSERTHLLARLSSLNLSNENAVFLAVHLQGTAQRLERTDETQRLGRSDLSSFGASCRADAARNRKPRRRIHTTWTERSSPRKPKTQAGHEGPSTLSAFYPAVRICGAAPSLDLFYGHGPFLVGRIQASADVGRHWHHHRLDYRRR